MSQACVWAYASATSCAQGERLRFRVGGDPAGGRVTVEDAVTGETLLEGAVHGPYWTLDVPADWTEFVVPGHVHARRGTRRGSVVRGPQRPPRQPGPGVRPVRHLAGVQPLRRARRGPLLDRGPAAARRASRSTGRVAGHHRNAGRTDCCAGCAPSGSRSTTARTSTFTWSRNCWVPTGCWSSTGTTSTGPGRCATPSSGSPGAAGTWRSSRGNTCWWQMRLADGGRTMMCYRDATADPCAERVPN